MSITCTKIRVADAVEYKPHHHVALIPLGENDYCSQIYAIIACDGYTVSHYHSGTEHLYVLEGLGKLTIADSTGNVHRDIVLERGVYVQVPPKIMHGVTNLSLDDLTILSTFTPSFDRQIHSFESR